MKFLASFAILIGVSGAAFYLVNSALADMTAKDCYVHKIQRACDAL
jgi:hypothetical protein